MIVSHRHRFVFIHCRKVAGSSMKLALSPHLGEDDLVVGSLDEMLDAGIRPTAAMEAVMRRPGTRLMTAAVRLAGYRRHRALHIAYKRRFRAALGRNPPHPPASRVAGWLGERRWNEYTTFCFVRNPYRQVVSDYLWRRRNTRATFGFGEYLEALSAPESHPKIAPAGWVSNWEMMSIDGELAVDFVGRFENMREDFAEITSRLGLGRLEIAGQSAKQSARYDYRSFYADGDVDKVTELFGNEIRTFGYSFSG